MVAAEDGVSVFYVAACDLTSGIPLQRFPPTVGAYRSKIGSCMFRPAVEEKVACMYLPSRWPTGLSEPRAAACNAYLFAHDRPLFARDTLSPPRRAKPMDCTLSEQLIDSGSLGRRNSATRKRTLARWSALAAERQASKYLDHVEGTAVS